MAQDRLLVVARDDDTHEWILWHSDLNAVWPQPLSARTFSPLLAGRPSVQQKLRAAPERRKIALGCPGRVDGVFGNEREAKLPVTRFTVIRIVCPTVLQTSATRRRGQRKTVTPQRCSPLQLQGSASSQRDPIGRAGRGRGNGLWRLPEGPCSSESLLLRIP
jgi:hypothetical protein